MAWVCASGVGKVCRLTVGEGGVPVSEIKKKKKKKVGHRLSQGERRVWKETMEIKATDRFSVRAH